MFYKKEKLLAEQELVRFILLKSKWDIINPEFDNYTTHDFNFWMRSIRYYRNIENNKIKDCNDGKLSQRNQSGQENNETSRLENALISCWAIVNDKLDIKYLREKLIGDGVGLLIYSTVGEVERSLNELFEKEFKKEVNHAQVCYYPQETESNRFDDTDEPFLCKDNFFSRENEYRFWIKLDIKSQLESIFFRANPSFIKKVEISGQISGINGYFYNKSIKIVTVV